MNELVQLLVARKQRLTHLRVGITDQYTAFINHLAFVETVEHPTIHS